jgi:hypothetical protein
MRKFFSGSTDEVVHFIESGGKLPNVSFAWTTKAFMEDRKTVTRRMWHPGKFQIGQLLMAIEKGQGIRAGERVRRLDVIEVVGLVEERVDAIPASDLALEGGMWRDTEDFITMFCSGNGCNRGATCIRMEFRRLRVPAEALRRGQDLPGALAIRRKEATS